MSNAYIYGMIGVIALATIIIRFIPFIIFKSNTPAIIKYLGNVLPYSIMAMLVVYCLKGVSFTSLSTFLPELIAGLVVVLVHKLKHNMLLSIIVGTVLYMLLINLI